MVYKALFCGCVMLAVKTAFCQREAAKAFNHLYHTQKHLFHSNAYICDSSISAVLLSPVVLKENLGIEDTSAAIEILKKGKPCSLKAGQIAAYLPQKPAVISMKRFSAVQPTEPDLSACEETVLSRLDSLSSLKNDIMYVTDHDTRNQEIALQEEKLYHSPCFISYLGKIREKTALFIFFPVIKFQNKYLIVWQYYYSAKENFITGRVISL